MTPSPIRPRDRDTIMQALRAGVVPRTGLQHIQVGRNRETNQMLRDLSRVQDGGAAVRFVIGDYGSGKTFFLNLVRQAALQQGMVTLSADITPDRRLHATGGQARALYAEMARNTATRARPLGGAMPSIIERFVTHTLQEAQSRRVPTDQLILERLSQLQELTGGYDFATVVGRYWQGYDQGRDDLQANALRWLRAEFSTRTDARNTLGVRTIIDDANLYDMLKLLSLFVVQAGYTGLLVTLDEMVNIHRLPSPQARQSNYEQLLRILNDTLQGSAQHLGFMLGGTPEFLLDTRRGLYSYPALQSRLAENTFATNGAVDLSGPVLHLDNLSQEDMYVLLCNIRAVALPDPQALPDDALRAFMAHCASRVGDAYFRTPRNTVTAFVNMLSVLDQNPHLTWQSLVGNTPVEPDENAAQTPSSASPGREEAPPPGGPQTPLDASPEQPPLHQSQGNAVTGRPGPGPGPGWNSQSGTPTHPDQEDQDDELASFRL